MSQREPEDSFTIMSVSFPELAIVVPTYNERDNLAILIPRLFAALAGIEWELIVVDDDSSDGTIDLVEDFMRAEKRIRRIQRIGRRGLSSACLEGMLATTASTLAVMDGDLQHDESILPRMLTAIRTGSFDVVVATRNAEGGSMGKMTHRRIFLSRLGGAISSLVCRCKLSDPMSGYFMITKSFFAQSARHMHGGGFKLLLDILASNPTLARVGEVGYDFRPRLHGISKLDVNAGVEYLAFILNRLSQGLIPPRFCIFALVGSTGVVLHLSTLVIAEETLRMTFVPAQSLATLIAMTVNFYLNNLITFRDRRLHGGEALKGLLTFWLACSFGAWSNLVFSRALVEMGWHWWTAGTAGIILCSVWNYSMSSVITWRPDERRDNPS